MSTQYDPNRFEPATGRPVNDDQRSFGQLLGDMVTEISDLFRKEIQPCPRRDGREGVRGRRRDPGHRGRCGARRSARSILLLLALPPLASRACSISRPAGAC